MSFFFYPRLWSKLLFEESLPAAVKPSDRAVGFDRAHGAAWCCFYSFFNCIKSLSGTSVTKQVRVYEFCIVIEGAKYPKVVVAAIARPAYIIGVATLQSR
jgi:hypothetical protein